ncbi:hypothetical protein [Picrophilus oshimae]|uniref:Hypothetical membrane protein n=1 Tax=Picrophilus torridus (strain ATCC 700027 / DSM 9790 / JCM 10055 / NBRC 100828 / KAW 2/3) TaxID=1122961 RepID=Q6L0H0_PICTO|nr:hypothetical protein [Picrophilus oshimae]AAT43532.1 hypothetical membrane protein [Picrophilus oshimae DSM 9789]
MVTADDVASYFREKAFQWIIADDSIENHVRVLGRDGLSMEFESDPNFHIVCQFVEEYNKLRLRYTINNAFQKNVNFVFGIPLVGAMDIIIGAVDDACRKMYISCSVLRSDAGLLISGIVMGVVKSMSNMSRDDIYIIKKSNTKIN